jgi:hypothetical protein
LEKERHLYSGAQTRSEADAKNYHAAKRHVSQAAERHVDHAAERHVRKIDHAIESHHMRVFSPKPLQYK